MYVVGGIIGGAALLWTLAALAWSSSVARHDPELRASTRQVRYGWRCPKCGQNHTPTCKVGKCRGPLVWVQRETTIKCARCHRRFIPHPFLFRMTPRPRRMFCTSCRSLSLITNWTVG
jgi:DNA-directed RNA polymerase subunit RPC12/RpoP